MKFSFVGLDFDGQMFAIRPGLNLDDSSMDGDAVRTRAGEGTIDHRWMLVSGLIGLVLFDMGGSSVLNRSALPNAADCG